MDCLFCKIASGELDSKKIYEDERIFAFHDISPKSPVHFLVIPKEHIPSADDVTTENAAVIGHIFSVIPRLAAELGLQNGYRIVNNCGEDGNQTVQHLHFHILGGRPLAWPPG